MRKRFLPLFLLCLVGFACTPAGDGGGAGGTGAAGSGGAAVGGTGGRGGPGGSGGQTTPPVTGGTSGGSAGTTGGTGTGSAGSGGASGTGGATAGSGGAGGGGNGGSSDAAGAEAMSSSDSAAEGPPPGAGTGCAGAKFCDDFEGQTVGQPPMGMFRLNVSGSAMMVVDGSKPYSGSKSIVIKGPAGSFGARMIFGAPLLPLPSNDMHGRAMVYFTAVPGGGVHFDIADGGGPLAGGGTSHYVLGGMYGNFMSVYHPGDCSVDSSTKWPAGRWACIQWQFKGAKDGSHTLRMLLDGKLVDKGETTTMGPANCAGANREWRAPTFNTLNFGYINYQRSPIPVEMWIDDLAFGEQPIDCPPPK